MPSSARRYWLHDIVCLSMLLIFLYCLWLGSYPLFMPDEGRYSAVAREMLFAHDYVTPRLDGIPFLDKPILYYWLQAAAMKLFGIKEWALRFFPMLLAVLNCLVLYTCARACFNRRIGLLSAFILSSAPLYFCGAHYANLDLEVAAFISMTLSCFMTGLHLHSRNRVYFFYTAYICAALAFLTKGMIGIAFPAMIAGLWILLNWRWDLLKKVYLPQGILVFLLIVSPWYIMAQRANSDFFHFFFITQQVTRFLSGADFNNENAWWFYVPVVLIGFFPWSIFSVQAIALACKHRHQNRTLLFALLWFATIFIFFSIPRSKTVGYIIAALPPLAILCAYYIDYIWLRRKELPYYLFSLFCIVFAAALIAIVSRQPFDLPLSFNPYLYFGACLFAIAAAASVVLPKKNIFNFLVLCFATSSLFLLSIVCGAQILNLNTAKPLITTLNQVRKPDEEIINYYKYYQDLTVYLGQRVTLVADWNSPNIPYRDNWVRELWFGMAMQKDHPWLIDDANFLQRWQAKKRVFVFINQNYFSQFTKAVGPYHEIGRYKDIILVSNQG